VPPVASLRSQSGQAQRRTFRLGVATKAGDAFKIVPEGIALGLVEVLVWASRHFDVVIERG